MSSRTLSSRGLRLLVWVSLAAVLAFSLAAQQDAETADPSPWEHMLAGKRQVRDFLAAEARRVTDRAAGEIASKEAWERLRRQRRQEMLDMLGLEPLPQRTPLNVQITGRIDQPEYTIEKIAFESLPKVYVTANLYIPKKREGPLPTVIYVCGHAYSPAGSKTVYQRHPITLARHGYVAMILDPIQIAETFGLHHGVYNNEMYDWYTRGYTPAGVEVWNAMRAMDYLETRPEVDKGRFGITGRSGGAAMSWFTAAVDERIKVVAPVMGISTYAANVADDTQRRHCDCMFVINTYLHDMLHQGALIAPRPLYMMHGRQDLLFPVEGYKEFERRVGELYASYGVRGDFKSLEVDTGHQDSDLLRSEAVKWFDKYLKKVPEREIDVAYTDLPQEQLAVFGGQPPADAQNYRVHEFFTAGPDMRSFATLAAWQQRREQLLETLRQKVLRPYQQARPLPQVRLPGSAAPEGFERLEFDSEQGISLEALYRKPQDGGGPALLYIASDGEDWGAIRDVVRQVIGSRTNPLMVVYPRGVGEVPWDKRFWKGTLRNAMHLGRTVDSMRLWDVAQATRVLYHRAREQSGSEQVVTVGIGSAGILGLYAALEDEHITQVMLIDPPASHRDGPVLLNALRYTDLPELAALLAPRRLTFFGRVPEAFQKTSAIYSLYDKADHQSLTMSIEAALNGRHDHRFASGL
jgi:cephalosporin-C deacetylase-like acetyl esterase